MSEKRTDENSGGEVPDEKFVDGDFGEGAFFPSDFGMKNVGENGGSESTDEGGKPEKIVIINNKVSEDGIKAEVENGDSNADN